MNTYLIDILKILEDHTDENNRLSLEEITKLMRRKHPRIISKTVKRNINKLIDLDYDINCTETTRIDKDGEEGTTCTDWYLNKDFTDAELHLLIDGLLFSKYIPYSQCKEIVGKLKKQSSKSFRNKQNLHENEPENKELLLTIEILNEAIKKRKQVSFNFTEYRTDKKQHLVIGNDGTPRIYTVSPYEIVVTNARYYLICAHAKGWLFNYRLDYIRNVKLIEDQKIRPLKEIEGYERGLDLTKYMKEHIYMYSGESSLVSFRAEKYIVGQIIDWFGKDVVFNNVTEDSVEATVRVNEKAMSYWALQYGQSVEILAPDSLRIELRDVTRKMMEKYNK